MWKRISWILNNLFLLHCFTCFCSGYFCRIFLLVFRNHLGLACPTRNLISFRIDELENQTRSSQKDQVTFGLKPDYYKDGESTFRPAFSFMREYTALMREDYMEFHSYRSHYRQSINRSIQFQEEMFSSQSITSSFDFFLTLELTFDDTHNFSNSTLLWPQEDTFALHPYIMSSLEEHEISMVFGK